MKKLNKRYEKSLKSVRAQKNCPCGLKCFGCDDLAGGKVLTANQSATQMKSSNTQQNKLW